MKKAEPILILLLAFAVFVSLLASVGLPRKQREKPPVAAATARPAPETPERVLPGPTPEPTPAPTPAPTETPEPVYLAFDDEKDHAGIYLNEPDAVDALEEKPDLLGWFENWGGELSVNKLNYCRENRITPVITWQPHQIPLVRVAGGRYDAYLHGFFEQIREEYGDMDILIRLAHEMEMRNNQIPWYTWQLSGEYYYKAMWRHVVEMGRAEAPNIKWIWSPNRADIFSEKFYPGGELVDYIGVTLNMRSGSIGVYEDFSRFYEQVGKKNDLEAYGKKIILGEVAVAAADREQKAAYLQSMFDYVREDPCIVGLVVFNENVGRDRYFNITDDPLCMDVFYEGVRSFRDEQ